MVWFKFKILQHIGEGECSFSRLATDYSKSFESGRERQKLASLTRDNQSSIDLITGILASFQYGECKNPTQWVSVSSNSGTNVDSEARSTHWGTQCTTPRNRHTVR
jgi:hypothetical protein